MIKPYNRLGGTEVYAGICDWCGNTADVDAPAEPNESNLVALLAAEHNWVFWTTKKFLSQTQNDDGRPVVEYARELRHFCCRKCRAGYVEHDVEEIERATIESKRVYP